MPHRVFCIKPVSCCFLTQEKSEQPVEDRPSSSHSPDRDENAVPLNRNEADDDFMECDPAGDDDDDADQDLGAIEGLRLTEGITGSEQDAGGDFGEPSSSSDGGLAPKDSLDPLGPTLLKAHPGFGPVPKSVNFKEVPVVIIHQHEVVQTYQQHGSWSHRNIEEFGLPQVIKLPKNTPIPFEFLQQRIRLVIGSFHW